MRENLYPKESDYGRTSIIWIKTPGEQTRTLFTRVQSNPLSRLFSMRSLLSDPSVVERLFNTCKTLYSLLVKQTKPKQKKMPFDCIPRAVVHRYRRPFEVSVEFNMRSAPTVAFNFLTKVTLSPFSGAASPTNRHLNTPSHTTDSSADRSASNERELPSNRF